MTPRRPNPPRSRAHDRRPYKLIVTDDPTRTLGECPTRHYRTLLDAANAFVKTREPYRQILYDIGHEARELNEREQALLDRVCHMLGFDVEQIDG